MSISDSPNGPFDADELEAQRLAGDGSDGRGIRDFMLDPHRAFFESLSYIFAAVRDSYGAPLATLLTGAAGFITTPDARRLQIAARPSIGDPAAPGFVPGAGIGLLGIDLSNRRRNRANGVISTSSDAALEIALAQSYGNCAKYIQIRRAAARTRNAQPAETFAGLRADVAQLIVASDTFFVATQGRSDGMTVGGMDISHRGGRPGFVRVTGKRLSIPDFQGNRFFNTFGNLLGDPRVGLLFPDFDHGDIVQLQGRASIDWSVRSDEVPGGALRIWHVDILQGWLRRQALPFSWTVPEPAPTSLGTGLWPQGHPALEIQTRDSADAGNG